MKRYLIVVENKNTRERYLYSPFKNTVPSAEYMKVTNVVPLDEERYGHLPLLNMG